MLRLRRNDFGVTAEALKTAEGAEEKTKKGGNGTAWNRLMRVCFRPRYWLRCVKELSRRRPSEIVNDEFTHRVHGCGIKVHQRLGAGLLENAYQTFYYRELVKNGFSVVRQKALPAMDEGVLVDLAYVPDLVVDNCLIVEIKTVKKLAPEHDAQLLTYLKFSAISLGLLMNFHAIPLMRGVKRLVWNHKDPIPHSP